MLFHNMQLILISAIYILNWYYSLNDDFCYAWLNAANNFFQINNIISEKYVFDLSNRWSHFGVTKRLGLVSQAALVYRLRITIGGSLLPQVPVIIFFSEVHGLDGFAAVLTLPPAASSIRKARQAIPIPGEKEKYFK